jgi:hypothetical protein
MTMVNHNLNVLREFSGGTFLPEFDRRKMVKTRHSRKGRKDKEGRKSQK